MTHLTFLDDVFHLLTALVTYLTFLDDVFHLLPALMRHVAEDAKDYEAGKDARAAVDERDDQRVPSNITTNNACLAMDENRCCLTYGLTKQFRVRMS